MFTKMSCGWELVKQSFRVLQEEKQLLVFPLLSGIACMAALASFVLPLWGTPQAQALLQNRQMPGDPLSYALLFLFYFVNYFVIVFFNSALIACVILRFRGGRPTIGFGLQVALARVPQIAGWALVSATVGLVLRIIESRSERVGQIVAGLLGMAWSIVTYFVVPVLVVEKVGPVTAVKRSTSILKKTWGEALTSELGLGLIFFLIFLAVFLPLAVVAAVAFAAGQIVLGGLAVAAAVILVILISLVSSALSTILLAALYIYAAEGKVPEVFDAELLEGAFKAK
ncbi:MAG: hypothetical protein JXB10_18825 [Pirellulales bacterium]|nr:hypothetical protein [Pirellulales bacterium]